MRFRDAAHARRHVRIPLLAASSGGWAVLARLAAACAGVVAVALFVAGVPLRSSQLHSICTAAHCARGQLTPDGLGALQRLGIPLGLYAAYDISLDVVFAAGYCSVGCLLL